MVDEKMCDECGERPARFTYEGEAEDGSEDEVLCAECISKR